MPGYPAIPAKQWNVTDQQLLSLIQLAMLEPDDLGATWPSAMWSQAEVVSYLNDAQRDFLHQTALTAAIAFQITTPNIARYDLPQNTIDVRRIGWRQGPTGTGYVELTRVDTWEMDYGVKEWPSEASPAPQRYLMDQVPTLTIELQPPPGDVGEADLTLVTLGVTLDGSGIALSVPDDWTPYIAWGVMARMLSKEGEAQDPQRAEYAMSRYQEGVALGRIAVEALSG